MVKKSKVKTPEWILEGYDSPDEYNKAKGIKSIKKSEKVFKVRSCPECGLDNLGVKIGEIGFWECPKCNWSGKDAKIKEYGEEEFMKYLDEKGEEVL